MMGMYSQFETDPKLESEGVWIDYGDFRILIAHAGGSNKKFQVYADQKLKPIRRAINAGTIDPKRGETIMHDIYAETIILSWEVADGADPKTGETKWKRGIEGKDGNVLPFNKENVILTLRNLPKLFLDLQEASQSLALFRVAELEDEAKNS